MSTSISSPSTDTINKVITLFLKSLNREYSITMGEVSLPSRFDSLNPEQYFLLNRLSQAAIAVAEKDSWRFEDKVETLASHCFGVTNADLEWEYPPIPGWIGDSILTRTKEQQDALDMIVKVHKEMTGMWRRVARSVLEGLDNRKPSEDNPPTDAVEQAVIGLGPKGLRDMQEAFNEGEL
jgi:hypothetical protein